MVLIDMIEDPKHGFPTEPLEGTFQTVDDANKAGNDEIVRRKAKPGTVSFKV